MLASHNVYVHYCLLSCDWQNALSDQKNTKTNGQTSGHVTSTVVADNK